jgi:hypothetical protein
MRRRLSSVLPMLVAVALFVLFHFDLTQKIPGLRCESFGCMGLGILMILSPLLVAVLFFVGGVMLAKQQRLKAGFVAAGTSFAFALVAVIAVVVLNKLEVNRAVDEACRADPATYCPHTLRP